MKKRKVVAIILIIFMFIGVIGMICYDRFFDNKRTNKTKLTETTKKEATSTSLSNSITINKGGEYSYTGEIKEGNITIETDEDVTITLTDVTITSNNGPAINVKNAKNVYLIIEGTNTLTATTNDEEDACIYSKDDLIISGNGTLTIKSNLDGITSKDDLKIKSGTYIINVDDDGMKGKDSVTIENGKFTINAGGDGIKTTNDEEDEKGIITINDGEINIISKSDGIDSSNKYIMNKGTININSEDDGIHADGYIEINDGNTTINGVEGIEATYIKINGGNISIAASDDGINASNKSEKYSVAVEINGGNITINMGQGDTDGIDSNGNLYINGGTLNITCNSPFDYDGEARYTGGTMIVNGEETTEITNQFMGGPGQGGMNGGPNEMNRY